MRTFSVLVAVLLALSLGSPSSAGDKDKKRKPKFTISKETTYVLGRVDKDGYIDYAAALNKRLSQGVTPQNNANALLWKAFGPEPDGVKMPPEFFKWMGIDPPSKEGDYFIDSDRYLSEHLKLDLEKEWYKWYEEQDRASQRPWTAKQYPRLAGWLKANEKPLALVVEATKRTHYFSPLVPEKTDKGSGGLMSVPVTGLRYCRALASAFAMRAMLRVGESRYDDAWQDLLACHRLGRHVARGSSLIETAVGIAIDSFASSADLAYLERAKLNTQQLAHVQCCAP